MNRLIAPALVIAMMATASVATDVAAAPAKKAAASAGRRNESDQSIKLYRFKNEKGALVTGTTISPEDAKRGYQIVTISGTVLETIAPEPTAEERAAYEKNRQDKLSAAKQQEKDKELMLRYSSVSEINVARQRRLTEIDDKVRMLNANLSTLKFQLDQERQQAAMFERNGQPVPPATLAKVSNLEQELKVTGDQLKTRQQELAAETARFDAELARYTQLEALQLKQPPATAQ